jgi:hypothetical protein
VHSNILKSRTDVEAKKETTLDITQNAISEQSQVNDKKTDNLVNPQLLTDNNWEFIKDNIGIEEIKNIVYGDGGYLYISGTSKSREPFVAQISEDGLMKKISNFDKAYSSYSPLVVNSRNEVFVFVSKIVKNPTSYTYTSQKLIKKWDGKLWSDLPQLPDTLSSIPIGSPRIILFDKDNVMYVYGKYEINAGKHTIIDGISYTPSDVIQTTEWMMKLTDGKWNIVNNKPTDKEFINMSSNLKEINSNSNSAYNTKGNEIKHGKDNLDYTKSYKIYDSNGTIYSVPTNHILKLINGKFEIIDLLR